MGHLTYIPDRHKSNVCKRAALVNNLERGFETGDIDDLITARDMLAEEVNRQIREIITGDQPIPYEFVLRPLK